MRRTVTALATAAALGLATVATPTPVEARNGRIAAGIIGGLAAGAIIGGALAAPRYYGPYGYYGPRHYGYYAPAWYGPGYGAYAFAPRCFLRRERVWTGYGWARRRVRVCY